jgi:hypothetical protein
MHTGWGRGVSSKKLSHKNAIKYEKKQKKWPPPPRFSDNPKYPPKKNLAETPRTPLEFQQLCIYGNWV